MKKTMAFVSAVILALSMSANVAPETSNNEIKNTEAFTETCINVPARVRFVEGESYSVLVNTSDAEVAKSIKCEVKDGVLTFYTDNGNFVNDKVVITIVSPSLPEVKTGKDFLAKTNK